MARAFLRHIDPRTFMLRGFRCGGCGWSYLGQGGQCDYWELLADARRLFNDHDCGDYSPEAPRGCPKASKIICQDCGGSGTKADGVPCTNCEGTGLVSVKE